LRGILIAMKETGDQAWIVENDWLTIIAVSFYTTMCTVLGNSIYIA